MEKHLFDELLESVQQGKEILNGERPPSRRFQFDDPDVSQLRKRFALTQKQFAHMLGISVATLCNWEQGRRRPEGPARVLLRIATLNPKAVLEATQPQSQ